MLSTEKWDNWGKRPLLFPFTALTCDENPIFTQKMPKLVTQSVDKNDIGRSFISRRIVSVMDITFICFLTMFLILTL